MDFEYAEDDLPLPSFKEVFGESTMSKNKKKKASKMGADETIGRWTAEEHRLFLDGIVKFGKDWKKMQPLIKTRSLIQIRTHAQKVFKKLGKKFDVGEQNHNSHKRLRYEDELDVDEELEADSQIIDSSQSLPPIPTPRSTWPLDGDSENMASMGLFSLSHMHRHEMTTISNPVPDGNSHSHSKNIEAHGSLFSSSSSQTTHQNHRNQEDIPQFVHNFV